MELALFSYRRGNSILHKIGAGKKMIFLFVFSLFVFWGKAESAAEILSIRALIKISFCMATSALLFFLAGGNWKRLFRLRFVFAIGIMFTALKMIGSPLDGLAGGLHYTARFFCAALAAQCVFETTTMLDIQDALRLPWIFSLAISFIPQIFSEWQKIRLAARSRTSPWRRKSLLGAAALALFQLQALLFLMLERAETKRMAFSNRRKMEDTGTGGGDFLAKTADKIIYKNYKIKKSEAKKIYSWPDLDALKKAAARIAKARAGNGVSVCALINAKQGKCSENCKYCAQSSFWNSNCQTKEMIEKSAALKIAQAAIKNGAERICVITSGRDLKGKDFEKALEIISAINKKFGKKIKVCVSLGLLDKERLLAVKNAGAFRAANNLETSENFFPKVCSSHSYKEKIRLVREIKKTGLELCSGGIIGMGESVQDRIDAALAFRKISADSIPVNILTAVPGTPLENAPPLDEEDFYRTIALLRFANPKAQIRLAAGRKKLPDNGKEALLSGANAFVTGGLLTLSGTEENEDLKLLSELS